MFFIVKPELPSDASTAFKLLSNYNVCVEIVPDKTLPCLVIYQAGMMEKDFVLVKEEFKVNFVQTDVHVCDLCKNRGENHCGHFTFSSAIPDVIKHRVFG
jgi:hypothetical protein